MRRAASAAGKVAALPSPHDISEYCIGMLRKSEKLLRGYEYAPICSNLMRSARQTAARLHRYR